MTDPLKQQSNQNYLYAEGESKLTLFQPYHVCEVDNDE